MLTTTTIRLLLRLQAARGPPEEQKRRIRANQRAVEGEEEAQRALHAAGHLFATLPRRETGATSAGPG